MKRLILLVLALAMVFVFAIGVKAQTSDKAKPKGVKAPSAAGAEEVLTAIDVAASIMAGSSDAEIAKSLSGQRGFDRESALSKGITDDQIIRYLVISKNPAENIADNSKFIARKAEGDKDYSKKQYDKAAREYTLAAKYSPGKYDPYKLRADSYKQYLISRLDTFTGSSSGETKQNLLDRARMLLCCAIQADYAKALEWNDKALSETLVQMNLVRNRMGSSEGPYDAKLNVDPTYRKSAQSKLDMYKLRALENQVRTSKQADSLINKAMSDYQSICGKEDATRRHVVKTEQDSKRDAKWIRYGEKDGSNYFYDKSGVTASQEYINISTRREGLYDEKAYDTEAVRVNCKLSTIGTIDFQSYDAIGNLASESHDKNPPDRKVIKGSIEEMLFKEVCK